jgi:CRP-like cAMP-binding protein
MSEQHIRQTIGGSAMTHPKCSDESMSMASTAEGSFLELSTSACSLATREDSLSPGDTSFGCLVKSMPPGSLIGHAALLEGSVQDATAMCEEDCELFVVDKRSFQELFEPELKDLPGKTHDFLCKHIPGIRALPKHERNVVTSCFDKLLVPKGHTFIVQGERAKKAIYIVYHGSVGLNCREVSKFTGLPVPGARQAFLLGRGKLFGSVGNRTPESFSVKCITNCEVLHIPSERMKMLPQTLVQSIKEHLAREAAQREKDCDAVPSIPSGKTDSSCRPLLSSETVATKKLSSNGILDSRTHCILPAVLSRTDWQDELDRVFCDMSHNSLARSQAETKSKFRQLPTMTSTPALALPDKACQLPQRSASISALSRAGEASLMNFSQTSMLKTITGPFCERRRDCSSKSQRTTVAKHARQRIALRGIQKCFLE